jgi:hypothetical protein
MKKFLSSFFLSMVFSLVLNAQVTTTNTADPVTQNTTTQDNFDKKFRFGLRVALQPSWFQSNNTSSKSAGANVGFGFGLSMEFRLSNNIHFLTGIGGDLEGGKISYRNDATPFAVREVIDNEGQMVEAKKGILVSDYDQKVGSTLYVLKQRQYKTTMVTIPLLLKMMTLEYSGFRYFAIFGGELGIRVGAKANDTFYSGTTFNENGAISAIAENDLKRNDIQVGKDASLIPLRFGLNVGLGTEYRLAGSTSMVFSVNYFQSFTNLMRNDSKYLTKDQFLDASTGTYSFTALSQSYIMRAVRINIGFMF